MSVRMRHTRSHTRNRRSHHAITAASVVADKESGNLRLPHRLDETTGMYRGKQIVAKKELKKEEKKKKSKAVEHEHGENTNPPAVKHDVKTEDRERKSQGVLGRMVTGRAKARSGMGGQAGG